VPVPTPSWGGILSVAQQFIEYAWWLVVFPGFAIFTTVAAFNVIGDRFRDRLEALAQRTRGEVLVGDLAVRGDVERLAAEAGDVDVLVANAALPGSGRLEGYDVDGIDRVLDVNLRAPIVLARLLAPGMLERGSGHVVLMSSLAGRAPTGPLRVTARIRHNHEPAAATLLTLGDGRAEVAFDEPQRAITPGQSCVWYQDDCVVGGGVIERASLTRDEIA